MPELPVEIELRPHVGIKPDPKTGAMHEVEHNQFIVLAKVGQYFGVRKPDGFFPKQIGYIGKWSGAQFVATGEFNQIATADRASVLKALSDKVKYEVEWVVRPPIVGEGPPNAGA